MPHPRVLGGDNVTAPTWVEWVWECRIRESSGVRSIDVGRTDGSSRYKTEDYLSCPVGTLTCVDGKYRCPDMLFLSVKPTLYNPKPLRCLYKLEG